MDDTPLHYETITVLAQYLRTGKITSVELVEHFLSRIKSLDGTLNAYRLVRRDEALSEAQAADITLQAGRDLGPLHGIPFAAKDLFDVRGLPTTAGTGLLAGNIAQEDATVIRKLLQAGMIMLGKTNTVQLAYSGIGINHDHGTPHNPWNQKHYVPGGSSSGSAVALAAGLAPMTLGSDTGGSVRIPASLCGTTGLKTTVGRISRAGVYPLSWSLDSIGPLTRSVEDAAHVYQCIQGSDLKDETTLGFPPHDVLKGFKDGVRGMRLAFAETVFWEDVHGEVEQAVRDCGKVFEDLGARVDSIEFEEAEAARQLNSSGLIIAAEAYALNRKLLEEHFDRLDPIVACRMVKGKDISAPDYLQNTLDWKRLRSQANHTLRDVDALLVPATCIPAMPLAEADADMESYAATNLAYLRNTSIGNILNLCGLSVPCGFTAEGLPIGLMIYGKSFQEDVVLRIGYAFQQATLWHKRTPDLAWTDRF
jgi:aspartyl-tRNA(Asn)/glutamyl-tRNA(Gln) amidotransferase subunit A